MSNIIDKINKKQVRTDIPEFRVGDTVRVDVWVKEGKKERIQAFEGLVVAKQGGSVSETFSVRKKSGGIGVVRTFPVNAPTIDKIVVVNEKENKDKPDFFNEYLQITFNPYQIFHFEDNCF